MYDTQKSRDAEDILSEFTLKKESKDKAQDESSSADLNKANSADFTDVPRDSSDMHGYEESAPVDPPIASTDTPAAPPAAAADACCHDDCSTPSGPAAEATAAPPAAAADACCHDDCSTPSGPAAEATAAPQGAAADACCHDDCSTPSGPAAEATAAPQGADSPPIDSVDAPVETLSDPVAAADSTSHDVSSQQSEPAPVAPESRDVIFVGNKPIMTYVSATLTQLAGRDTVTIKARGKKITNAVDVSQMIIKRMDSVGYVISDVRISSDSLVSNDGKPRNVSIMEIDISRN